MNRINYIDLTEKRFLLIVVLMSVNFQTFADEVLGSNIDCSDVTVNYIDRPDMTRSERLEAMNRAFFESVNRFESCNFSNQSSASAESTNETEQVSSAGSEAAINEAESSGTGFDSVASPLMTGTEIESTLPASDSLEDSNIAEKAHEDDAVAIYGGGSTNSVMPGDIPAVNNDDAVAAQIRLAAEIEKDAVKKEKLWNEYRKYKGLPVNNNEK
jgi:hypothetical protein